MKNQIRDILKRLRKIWKDDGIKIEIGFWQYNPCGEISPNHTIWVETLVKHFYFKSIPEIEEWLRKKELLFRKF